MRVFRLLGDFYITAASATESLGPYQPRETQQKSLEEKTEDYIDPRFERMWKNKLLISIYHNLIGLSKRGIKDYF